MKRSKKRVLAKSSIIKNNKIHKKINHVIQKYLNKVTSYKQKVAAHDYNNKRQKKVVGAKAIKVIKYIVYVQITL